MKEFLQCLSRGDLTTAMALFAAVAVRILFAVFLWWLGRKVIRKLLTLLERGLAVRQQKGMDAGLAKFLASLCKVGMYTILFVMLFELLGQGSLSNFAGGVLILLTKPFVVGDYIVASGMEGTVREIGICYTRLLTPDNRTVILPNGSLANSNLINVSAQPERRVDIIVPISYEDDIRGVREMLLSLANSNDKVLSNRPYEVYVKEFGESSVNMVFRVWVKKENYWPVYFGLMEDIKYAMQERGFTIPFTQVDIHLDKTP